MRDVIDAIPDPRLRSDAGFDELVPGDLRRLSFLHWTPVSIAMRAARWLAPEPGMRVLDVGAGVGKMCVVGASSTQAEWCGIEQNRRCVEAALGIAAALELSSQTSFIHADAFDIDWAPFDAIYFYNPFELLAIHSESGRHRDSVLAVEQRLATMRPGTRVVTYHGFGGVVPPTFDLVHREMIELGELELWIQRGAGR
jgi:hypothetical protein